MATGDTAPPPPAEPSGVTPTERHTGETRLSGSRVGRAAGGFGRGEWTKIIVVIGAGLVLAGTLLFAMPSLQVKASYYRCPLPLPTPTSSADVSSLSTSCRAPGAGGATTDQQALDAARSAARAPYGVLAAALLAGAAAVVGVIVNSHNARLTRDTINATLDANDATRHRDATTAELTRAGQYTDRYIKAIGLINDDKVNARLGGLYALEQLAKEAPRTFHATIVDVLSAYIRGRAPWPPATPTSSPDAPRPRSERRVAAGRRDRAPAPPNQPKRPALDIQTTLTILGRRNPTHTDDGGQNHELEDHRLDLSQACLKGAYLVGAHLEGATLFAAHLEDANLREAHLGGARFGGGTRLERANLGGAHLEGAVLRGVRLEGARLGEARLEGANLSGVRLEGAYLGGAHLEGARLVGARLKDANLREAHLGGAYLGGARLGGANLSRAHLGGTNLSRAHLEGAYLVGARLEGARLDGARLDGARLDDGALSREQLATALFEHGPQLPGDQER